MTDDLRTPPHDLAAERAVLGSMLLASFAVEDGLQLGDSDFYHPPHRLIHEVIADLFAEGKPIDPLSVNAELQERGLVQKTGGGLYLHELTAAVTSPGSIGHFVEIVRDRSTLRSVLAAAQRAQQWAYEPQGDDANTIAERAADAMRRVSDWGSVDDTPNALTLDQLLAEEITYNWLVPGLLERGDRLVITGAEGLGKSTVARQIAVAVAAGLHPFNLTPVEPRRVLVIDCENGRQMSQRKFRPMAEAAARKGHPVGNQLHLEIRPEGLDLHKHQDARWLLKRVEKYQPDLLVIGPLYRLAMGDSNDDTAAKGVAAVLDKARAVSGCALVMETHSPHQTNNSGKRTVRPFGSSVWLRWPEFGYGIQYADEPGAQELRLVDWVPWRGARDERQWPHQLIQGSANGWPWEPFNRGQGLRAAA